MPPRPAVRVFAEFKEKEDLEGYFAKLLMDFNLKFNMRTAIGAMRLYKDEVIKRTPEPKLERFIRYGPYVQDPTRYKQYRSKGEYSLQEAIGREDPVIETGKVTYPGIPGATPTTYGKAYVITAQFGNIKRINARTNFHWIHKKRDKRRPGAMLGYEQRSLNKDEIDTLQKFEFGGTWTIKPRNPGERLHPIIGRQITYSEHWREIGGERKIIKEVRPRHMFSGAVSSAKRQIESYIRQSMASYLSTAGVTVPQAPQEHKKYFLQGLEGGILGTTPVWKVGRVALHMPRRRLTAITRSKRKALRRGKY
jgi:hypothetical protein